MSQDLTPPERIYLEPRESDPDTGRLWCVDQIEEDWTEYIRADLAVSGTGRTSGGNSQPLTKPVPDAVVITKAMLKAACEGDYWLAKEAETLTDPMEYLEHGPDPEAICRAAPEATDDR